MAAIEQSLKETLEKIQMDKKTSEKDLVDTFENERREKEKEIEELKKKMGALEV